MGDASRIQQFTTAEVQAILDIVHELARMDTSGLPKDGTMATAAGSLSVRAVNRARWLSQQLTND